MCVGAWVLVQCVVRHTGEQAFSGHYTTLAKGTPDGGAGQDGDTRKDAHWSLHNDSTVLPIVPKGKTVASLSEGAVRSTVTRMCMRSSYLLMYTLSADEDKRLRQVAVASRAGPTSAGDGADMRIDAHADGDGDAAIEIL